MRANDGVPCAINVLDAIRSDGYCLVVACATHSSNHAAPPGSATDQGTRLSV